MEDKSVLKGPGGLDAPNETPKKLRMDPGDINSRLFARKQTHRLRAVEGAGIKVVTRLVSAEGKRLFLRLFQAFQINVHYISVVARTSKRKAAISEMEAAIRKQIETGFTQMNKMLDDVDALFKKEGITQPAAYEAPPLWLEVAVMSSLSRRYLELIDRLDQIMPLLLTLEIHEIRSAQQVDMQRVTLKRIVKRVSGAANGHAIALRRLAVQAAGSRPSGHRALRKDVTHVALGEDSEPQEDLQQGDAGDAPGADGDADEGADEGVA